MKKQNRIREEVKEQKTNNFSSRQEQNVSTISEEDIRRRAYELAEVRGFEPGHEVEDWLEAEKTVKLYD